MEMKNHLDWDNFLPEIAQEILSRLPAESALQCKQVSKTWQTFFGHTQEGVIFAIGLNRRQEPNFRLYYATHHKIEEMYGHIKKAQKYHNVVKMVHHPPIENRFHGKPSDKYKDVIVGSCNGLVCITLPNRVIDEPVYICNPFTRESVNLPRLTSVGVNGLVVSGFGFYSTNQHKVVRIYYPDHNVSVGHVQVYTLGGGTGWRSKGEIAYSLCPSPGILVDGVLYWIDYKEKKILGFNLADERFGLLPSPPCLYLDKSISNNNLQLVQQCYRLKILRGCLCVVHDVQAIKRILFLDKASKRTDIWFYTTKDGSHDKNSEAKSWRRELSIRNKNMEHEYDPYFITEKNKVLLWHNKSNLVCFDPKTSTSKVIIKDESCLNLKYFSAVLHINTSVSLKALEGKSCIVREWDDDKGTVDELRRVTKQQTGGYHLRPGAEIWGPVLTLLLPCIFIFLLLSKTLYGEFIY